MTLLENTYAQLRNAGLVNCAEAFSRHYLHKNKNWFAFQRHTGRDFSVNAAIQCLRTTRTQQHATHLTSTQRHALQHTETQLMDYLHAHHSIAEVA